MIHLFLETNLCQSHISLDGWAIKHQAGSKATLSLLRLTSDKSFNAHQEILPA